MKKILAFAIASLSLFSSCDKKDHVKDEGFFKGPEASLHHSKIWSSIKLDKNNVPEQLILTLKDQLIDEAKMVNQHGAGGGHHHDDMVNVALHPKAVAHTPFKFINVAWNPQGHEPAGIYDTAHFDFHFYLAELPTVTAMVDQAKLMSAPAAAYLPANHISGAPVPQMGLHWLDITSPELSGVAPFTETFIYGSYDAKVVFYEPMITWDFLKTTANYQRQIPQPASFQQSGYYPTKMRVVKRDGTTNIILDGFVYRTAS
jgi:hypothetical protein